MKRREFITLLSGAMAAVWPPAAWAQNNSKIRIVGVLANEKWAPIDGLRDGLLQLGYIEGQNLNLVQRYVEGQAVRYDAFAVELFRLPVEVLVTWGTPPSLAAKKATSTIPIIMISGDPVAVGLVPGLPDPGGNVTGLSTQAADLEGKRLELVTELVPNTSRIAVLSNPTNPYCAVAVESARAAAAVLHLKIDVVDLAEERDLDKAFGALRSLQPSAVLVVADPFLASQQIRIAEFLVQSRLPSVYTYRESVRSGGLLSYAPSYYEIFRRAAVLADKILKGAKPRDLPVEQPTKFELVINLKTAKALGIEVPPILLARADEVIE